MKKVKVLLLILMVGMIGVISINAISHKKLLRSKLKTSVSHELADSFKDGDLIFQTNTAGQGLAIQLATHSPYTHIGILFRENGEWKVYEAVEPVQVVSLNSFISHGQGGKYVVRRLQGRDTLLTDKRLGIMTSYLRKQLGKHYDIHFGWSDDRQYCSELVWKAYHEAGISIVPLKKLKEFDLSSPIVKKIMADRYGNNIPYNEQVVSPGDIFDDKNMIEVYRN